MRSLSHTQTHKHKCARARSLSHSLSLYNRLQLIGVVGGVLAAGILHCLPLPHFLGGHRPLDGPSISDASPMVGGGGQMLHDKVVCASVRLCACAPLRACLTRQHAHGHHTHTDRHTRTQVITKAERVSMWDSPPPHHDPEAQLHF